MKRIVQHGVAHIYSTYAQGEWMAYVMVCTCRSHRNPWVVFHTTISTMFSISLISLYIDSLLSSCFPEHGKGTCSHWFFLPCFLPFQHVYLFSFPSCSSCFHMFSLSANMEGKTIHRKPHVFPKPYVLTWSSPEAGVRCSILGWHRSIIDPYALHMHFTYALHTQDSPRLVRVVETGLDRSSRWSSQRVHAPRLGW